MPRANHSITGRAARLAANDPLLGTPYLVAGSIDAGDREGLVHLAAPVSVDEIEEHLSAQIESLRELRWDGGVDDVVGRRQGPGRGAGQMELKVTPI